jgi:hypothetical protein
MRLTGARRPRCSLRGRTAKRSAGRPCLTVQLSPPTSAMLAARRPSSVQVRHAFATGRARRSLRGKRPERAGVDDTLSPPAARVARCEIPRTKSLSGSPLFRHRPRASLAASLMHQFHSPISNRRFRHRPRASLAARARSAVPYRTCVCRSRIERWSCPYLFGVLAHLEQ